MSHFLRDATSLKKIFWLYGLGFILPILSALFIHSQTGFIQASSFSACQPFYSDHTLYAACLAFIIPFFILESRQSYSEHKSIVYFNIAMVALLFVAIYFSYSRAAWISLFIALVVYIIIKLKIKFFYIAILLISLITVIATNFESIYGELRENDTKYSDDATAHLSSVTNLQNDASNLERINRWVCAYRMFEERPLLGFGPGTYQFVYDQFQTPEYMTRISTHKGDKGNAHSEYFSYLSETGIIGLIVFMGIVIYSIYLSFNILSRNITKEQRLIVLASLLGLITFFTHGLFNTFSDYEKMSVLYLGSLAILTKVDFDSKAKDI
jgi:O-antigen ligase